MSVSDERVTRGTAAHLERWRERLSAGESRVGWKIGLNPPPAMQAAGIDAPVVGHLTSGTELPSGGSFALGGRRVAVEPEVFAVAGEGGGVVALGAALEVVEPDRRLSELEELLAANIFHRAVAFGPPAEGAALAGVTAGIAHNGEEYATVEPAVSVDPAGLATLVADTLATHGESLEPGDRIICGTLTKPVEVAPGDTVALDLGELGSVELRFED